MQYLMQLDYQNVCDELLEVDKRLVYTSFLDSSGLIVAESIRGAITNYDHLTVVVLPLGSRKDSVVLASVVGSDLTSIVENMKKLFSSQLSSSPALLEA